MKQLPVPPLDQTLTRFLSAVRPLLTETEFVSTRQAAADFAAHEGPLCQRALEEFASAEQQEDHSWLSRAWLDSYWRVRTPLPLSTSVGVQFNLDDSPTGLAGAAELIHRLAQVHLNHLSGDLEPERTPRGDAVCDLQRRYLAGGLREPRPEVDEFRVGPQHHEDREIGVLWRDRMFVLPVGDAAGRARPVPVLAATLEQICAEPATPGVGFTAASYLGSEKLAEILPDLLAVTANADTYRRLADLLFTVTLLDEPMPEAAALERTNFLPGQAWAYKPVSYQISLVDAFAVAHMEHSIYDGGTCLATVREAWRVVPTDGEPTAVPISELRWELTDAQRRRLDDELQAYRAEAVRYRCRIVSAESLPPEQIPVKISQDACLQFVMLYAQLATYNRLRSTYEAVDMREYHAGRTECLRPNTPAAVSFVQALRSGSATWELLQTALDQHRTNVKQAKSGQGFARHLFGLRLMAERLGLAPALFADPAIGRLETDFLSTTSLGEAATVQRVSFAATSPGGIGIYYVDLGGSYEFLLNYRDDQVERLDEFAANLVAGTKALWEFITTHAPAQS